MDSALPLKPAGFSFLFQATPGAVSTSPSVVVNAPNGDVVYLFDATKMPSGSRAWVGYGMTSSAAQANSAIPLLGGPPSASCFALAAGTVQGFTLNGTPMFLNATRELGSSTIGCTVGFGV